MNRLEKKCFITATAAHGLLVVILFVGPAFFVSPENNNAFKPITVFDPSTLSKELTSGGTPQPVQAVAAPLPPAPTEQKAVEPAPKPPDIPKPPKTQVKEFEPPKPEIKIKPIEHGDEPVVKPKKHVVEIDPTELVSSKSTADKLKAERRAEEERRARAQAAAEKRQRDAQLKEIGNMVKSIKNNLSGATVVSMPVGAGGGGAASVNYRDLIASKFYNAWNPSFSLNEDTPDVTISITITRDGSVTGHITRRSGISSMDKSVQSALDTVTFIEPFPESFKEQQMTIPVIFNLHVKRQ